MTTTSPDTADLRAAICEFGPTEVLLETSTLTAITAVGVTAIRIELRSPHDRKLVGHVSGHLCVIPLMREGRAGELVSELERASASLAADGAVAAVALDRVPEDQMTAGYLQVDHVEITPEFRGLGLGLWMVFLLVNRAIIEATDEPTLLMSLMVPSGDSGSVDQATAEAIEQIVDPFQFVFTGTSAGRRVIAGLIDEHLENDIGVYAGQRIDHAGQR